MSLIFVFIAVIKGVFGLRLVRLDVPSAVVLGHPVWLNCTYDLGQDQLYSLKWYKNGIEFYRFQPSDEPSVQNFLLKGTYVDLSRSRMGYVYMSTTDHNTEGNYRCEVSTEAPSFQTVRDDRDLKIYVLPQEGPRITGTRPQYKVGDVVNTTCVSGPSKPPAALKWFINGNKATQQMEHHLPSLYSAEKLRSSVSRLTFMVEPGHFIHGMMKLRCTAIISQAYSMSSEEIIAGADARPTAGHYGDDSGGPVITGGLPRYQVGDVVHVNCTASKSKPAAELQWFLNEHKAPSESIFRYPVTRYPDGQETSTLGLKFNVLSDHFQQNEMRLKCTATLSKILNMSSQDSVLGSSQQSSLLHIYENSALSNGMEVPGASSRLLCLALLSLVFSTSS